MILNCTNHISTEEQVALGVIEPDEKDLVKKLITFDSLESLNDIEERLEKIKNIIIKNNCDTALIGGAPFLMPFLESFLLKNNIKVAYAFSKRVSKEYLNSNGELEKISIFSSNSLIIKNLDGQLEFLTLDKQV